MKKIKLLTALLSLPVFGALSAPLTSCGTNKGSDTSEPVQPEGGKSIETIDGISTFAVKFAKQPDGGIANVSIANQGTSNQVEIKTNINVSSTTVSVGSDLRASITIGFISLPTKSCETYFNLSFNFNVNGKSTTSYIQNCSLKYSPSSVKYTVTFNKGEHGTISKESVSVPEGTLWSVIEKPTVTPESGYIFSKWVDQNGNEISDNKKIDSDFTAIASYVLASEGFAKDSWTNVCTYANQGLTKLKQVYGVSTFIGLERTIKLNGKVHTVRVIGENHDTISGTNSTAALTFDLVTLLSDSEGNAMKSKWDVTNNENYLNSVLRKNLTGNGTASGDDVWSKNVMTMLSDENLVLYNNLKSVNKQVATTSEYTVTTYSDKLFPLTYTEMAQSGAGYVKTEGTAYQYWTEHKSNADRQKKDVNGTGSKYWLSTPDGYYTTSSWYTDTGGAIVCLKVTNTFGVSFGFCI